MVSPVNLTSVDDDIDNDIIMGNACCATREEWNSQSMVSRIFLGVALLIL
jgi:hypothetical protein